MYICYLCTKFKVIEVTEKKKKEAMDESPSGMCVVEKIADVI